MSEGVPFLFILPALAIVALAGWWACNRCHGHRFIKCNALVPACRKRFEVNSCQDINALIAYFAVGTLLSLYGERVRLVRREVSGSAGPCPHARASEA